MTMELACAVTTRVDLIRPCLQVMVSRPTSGTEMSFHGESPAVVRVDPENARKLTPEGDAV